MQTENPNTMQHKHPKTKLFTQMQLITCIVNWPHSPFMPDEIHRLLNAIAKRKNHSYSVSEHFSPSDTESLILELLSETYN